MYVERTFSVPRPVDAVFAYLSDFTHTEQWDPGTTSTERTGGDGGVGTTYRNVSTFLGREVKLDYETVVHEPPRKVQFRGRNGTAYGIDTMTFTPDGPEGEATSIHYRADFDFGVLINLIAPIFLRKRIEKLADETIVQIHDTIATL